MTTTAPSTPAAPAVSPTAALASRVAALRTRAGDANRDRLMLYVGGALLPLGLLVVILGWYGASHTVLLFEQIPYLISGGQIGTALVFAGGFIYFAYWLSLLVRESRTRHDEMVTVLRDIHAQMVSGASAEAALLPAIGGAAEADGTWPVGAAAARGPASAGSWVGGAAMSAPATAASTAARGPAPASAAPAPGALAATGLVATPTGSMAHRPECQVVAGKANLRPVADPAEFIPCKLCRPLG